MILPALLAFVPAVLIGVLTVLLAWPGAYNRNLALKIALGLGIGPGITSCLYFLFSQVLRPRSRAYWLLEAAVLIALLVAAALLAKKKQNEIAVWQENPSPSAPGKITYLLITALAVIVLLASASFTIQSLMQPHGIQDAWNIWNMRARFLFRGGPDWKDLFTPAIYWLNHPDYPFLVTAGSARAWSLLGVESTFAPMVQAGLYALGLLGVIFSGLGIQRSWGQGALAALLLASSSWFVLFGAWQISDVPLDFFFTASVFMFVLTLSAPIPTPPSVMFLFGLSAGLAAWTKNEGILFLVVILGIGAAARLFTQPKGLRMRELGGLAMGLLLPLTALFWLKVFLAPPNDLFAGQSDGSILARLSDLSRYSLTLSYLWRSILNFSWFTGWSLSLLPLLAIFALLFWPARRPQTARGLLAAALCLFILFLGYFVIYIITPHDLVWHLRTAANRLVFHLYPPVLLILFWTLRSPEEVVNQLRKGKS